MGFLDHSTNNIIVDAVLTDRGRKALSRNDGSFSIYKFALADDEVDYQVIQHYGRTVGKEKIEKNTPIMEALTLGSLGQKYRLLAASNQFLTRLPSLTIKVDGSAGVINMARAGVGVTKDVEITIENQAGISIDRDIQDNQVRVELNDLFLTIQQSTFAPDFKYSDNIAVYTVASRGSGSKIVANFTLEVKQFSDTVYTNYSVRDGTYIRTYMTIAGINSGVSGNNEIKIKKTL